MDTRTPLIAAISNHHIEAVKIFLGAGALVDNADMGRKSPLLRARTEFITKLLLEHGADPNKAEEWDKSTPLLEAAFWGHNEVICILLETGADTEQRNKWGTAPLINAASPNHIEAVKILLGAKALVDNADMDGRSPLWWTESEPIAKILLDHGDDPNKADENGTTPLHRAALRGNGDIIISLIEGGAEPRL